ncbi:uncharacterized protein At1g65710-like [Cynara cardunculus var. scolymus]|uniref:Uncharacterized protein n=1 Tax=Cynara cardunculus var. scolymus TaxID=59895 RepID=A0A103YGH9_CYNCS|nr:uncharacterized protein At1g65710-like [Cynara cardunculus var. scolymus]KVI08696.1 hypothetical protein Ccrd_012939 [Cynara cardunculus var. scolymus]
MGACCSKTNPISSTPTPHEVEIKPQQPEKKTKTAAVAIVTTAIEQQVPKKEVLVVKHRKSHEIDRHPDQETRKSMDRKKTPNSFPTTDVSQSATTVAAVSNGESGKAAGATVRTSSCTKEEVDAILIQCGRLSRSSSGVKPAAAETPTRGRRYSGSKRSYDFDMEMGSKNDDDDEVVVVDGDHHRRRPQREPRVSSPSSRRRSRERDPQQQRSGSKERGSGTGNGGGRRVSRSPNRRSESPNPNSTGSNAAAVGGSNIRPGKMVSVPATDKTNNTGGGEVVTGVATGVKRIQVKRNTGEAARTAASPRSRSPARANLRVLNENQNQQPLTLSRSNSRKAEHSPYRRNPLAEIDTNATGSEQPAIKVQMQKPNGEKMMNNKTHNVVVTKNCIAKEHQMIDEAKIAVENPKIVSRTRSSRLSRDLDINPETLLNPNPTSYASLLLEDIQNFHQKTTTTTTTVAAAAAAAAAPSAFSLPACVSKACSILEAVADLNSATSSNERQFKKDNLVESEMVVNDDLMEPSLHKYVTVRRGGDADTEEQESSGSNSFAGSQQLSWMSSSWEPNSADSSNCWSSSRSNARDTELLRSGEYPRNGVGRGRVGSHGRSAYSLPNNTAVALT